MIPTVRITGIECKALWEGKAPNYWQIAWQGVADQYLRHFVKKHAVGMAINSEKARNYDQFHIHVKCIEKKVSDALVADDKNIGTTASTWFKTRGTFNQNAYRVFKVDDLKADLFTRLEKEAGAAKMKDQTLVVAQRPAGGFYVLDSADVDLNNGTGIGEKLLDPKCSTW